MHLGGTFEIGTQIILLKIDGFLKGLILNITPLKYSFWINLVSFRAFRVALFSKLVSWSGLFLPVLQPEPALEKKNLFKPLVK